ncbi:MAG: HD domain-containing protein [Chitinivibrionia bacterium]|nr:HD domain-containing protein [Chitinivibrionia bacterium]
MAMVVFLASLFVFFPRYESGGFESYPQTGDISKELITAPFAFDIMKTDYEVSVEKEFLTQRSLPVFRFDLSVYEKTAAKIDSVINLTKNQDTNFVSPISNVFLDNPEILADFKVRLLASTQNGLLDRIVVTSDEQGEKFLREHNIREPYLRSQRGFLEISNDAENAPAKTVAIESVENIHEFCADAARDLAAKYEKNTDEVDSKEIFSAILLLAEKIAAPSLIYDKVSHEKKLQEIVSSINPVKFKIMKDQAIVRPHELVSEDAARILETLRKKKMELSQDEHKIKQSVDTVIIFVLIIMFAVLIVVHTGKFIPQFLAPPKYFLCLAIICAIQFFLVWLTQIVIDTISEQNGNLPQTINRATNIISWAPMFTGILLTSLLFGRRTGVFVSLFFTIYFLFVSQFNIAISLSILAIGGFVSHFAQKIRYRRHLLWLILFMMLSNILLQFLLNFVCNALSSQTPFTIFAAPCLNVLISTGIVYMALPLFEYMFGIITITTLLELTDMSNKLLKRLAIEAPGTFSHSLAVGNLAELGAEKVGANPLFCRVLAYYHDVGKIKNPVYFTENQLNKKNPHDKLSPVRSTKILISHIGDGCDLIDEYKIPKVIKNGIIQHHGTGFAGTFYQKALENKKEGEEINPDDFCYPGEKPQTKETAILMLADKVEAMSKSLKGESESDLRKKIHDNVRKIVISGQLDECGLTFRNVFDITNSFMPALKGIFHERIEYPEEDKNGKE